MPDTKTYKKFKPFSFLKDRLSVFAIIISFLVFAKGFWDIKKFNDESPINYDAIYYYSYVPALLIHHDLTMKFKDTDPKYSSQYWPETTPNGAYVNKMTSGVAIFFLPFFLIGHIIAIYGNYVQDGYSLPYVCSLLIGTIIYATIALMFLRKVLLRYFNDTVTALTLLSVAIGTNLFYFVIKDALISHAYTFMLGCMYLLLIIKWHEQPTFRRSVLLGLVGGLIVLIRPVNVLVVLVFLLYKISNRQSLREKIELLLSNKGKVATIIISAFITFIPHMCYWKFVEGDWIYYSYQEEGFHFDNPHVILGLFSYRKGWLLYTPIMCFSILGFLFLRNKLKEWLLALTILTPVTLYIIFSWWCWWYGGTFGCRPIVDYYPYFAISMGAFYNACFKKLITALPVLLLSGFFIYVNLFQTYQYHDFQIHWDSMTKKSYWDVFLSRDARYNPYDLKPPSYPLAKQGFDEY